MSFDLGAVGQSGDELSYEVTEDALQAYAAATDDVPGGPVFAIVPASRVIALASRSVASDEIRSRVVHYEQDFVVHRPLASGMRVRSSATPVAVLGRPNGTSLVIHTESRAEDGELLNEQYVTEFFREVEATESVGERPPDHRVEAEADDAHLGSRRRRLRLRGRERAGRDGRQGRPCSARASRLIRRDRGRGRF